MDPAEREQLKREILAELREDYPKREPAPPAPEEKPEKPKAGKRVNDPDIAPKKVTRVAVEPKEASTPPPLTKDQRGTPRANSPEIRTPPAEETTPEERREP